MYLKGLRSLSVLTALTVFTGSVLVHPTQLRADYERIEKPDYKALGFHSEDEMKDYLTITDTEISEVQTPPGLWNQIIMTDLGRTSLVPTPLPIPGQVLPLPIPGQIPGTIPGQIPGTIPGGIVPTLPNLPTMPTVPRTGLPVITGNPAIDVLMNPGLIDAWVTIGLKVWSLIAANKPVANVNTQRIAVVPSANIDWTQMSNWKGPTAHTYSVKKKNLFGSVIVENTYTMAWMFGGQVNNKGSFIANATIIPSNINVSFGFSLNSEVQAGTPMNTASVEAPVAGIEMSIRWKADSFFKHQEGTDAFFIKGDGSIARINDTSTQQIN